MANLIYRKTGFPDMLILIFVGLLLGPIFGIFNPTLVKSLSPFIAALALSYTIFNGGLDLNIRQVIKCSPKAVYLAVVGLLFSTVTSAAFVMFVYGMPLLYGLLFGVIFGGSSSVVVVSLISKIKIREQTSTILVLESAITDIFSIIIAVALIDILFTGAADFTVVGFSFITKFLVGITLGLALGLMWLLILRRSAGMPFSYVLTLGIVLLGYAGAEAAGGSGVLCVLIFGLILGNEKETIGFFRRHQTSGSENGKSCLSVSRGLLRFSDEIAFLIATFFFVFLGMIASIPSLPVILSGVILSVIMLATRYGAVWVTTYRNGSKKDRGMLTVVLTRGLATAVLATLPAQYGLLYSDIFIDVSIIVVIITAIMATVGSMILSHNKTTKLNGESPG